MVAIFPFVPEEITVHLGAPNEDAPNVRVPYLYYLQNAAASEIYPTWELSAIRANVLAINSYALNRIYTQYYPTRGYDFDITNTTAYDQAFVNGRSTFENIDRIAQELVGTYIRRQGNIEP
ncbi:MAG: SpoIID/LytB domain-containing protein, partial [Oscillospiraceae bacterium]|nr:SpoIID/LytB domain-containing protein [Oscillospiraceae bacterium]